MQNEGLDTQIFFHGLYEDIVMKTLDRDQYPDFYEDPIKTYKVKSGEIAKLKERKDTFILGKFRTWKAKGHISEEAPTEAGKEYPKEAIYIKKHPYCPQFPRGIWLTPLKREPGTWTVEKASGAKRIEFDGSITDAFNQFYANTEIKLALIVYKSLKIESQ